MKLTCPSCGTSFLIDDSLLGEKGRKVRCSKCKHAWHQVPGEEAPPVAAAPQGAAASAAQTAAAPAAAPQAAAPAQPAAPAGGAQGVAPGGEAPRRSKLDEPPRRLMRQPPPPPAQTRSRGIALGWAILLLAIVSTVAALWFGRTQLVAMVPEMKRLYTLVGLPVEEPIEDALHLRDVTSVRREVDGQKLVVIEGYVINLSDKEQNVPLLRAELKGPPGLPSREWTFEAEQKLLGPGASTRFETQTVNPPNRGELSISFVH